MTSKTIVLTGEEIRADYSGGTNAWLRNDGTATVYASTAPGVTAGADGTVSIPAGQSVGVYGANGTVYLKGTGSVQLIGSDYSTNPFRNSAASGGSGADDVARAALEAHAGNADIHVTAEEKSAWDGLSNPNLLINPDFSINQRGANTYSTRGYSADRWILSVIGTGNTGSYNADTHEIISNIKDTDGFYASMQQHIENPSRFAGMEMTFSANITALDKTSLIQVWRTENGVTTAIAVTPYNTETEKILNFVMPDDLTEASKIRIILQTRGNAVLNWAKLELGSVATPFLPPDPATELAKCQRYLFVLPQWSRWRMCEYTSKFLRFEIPTPIKMRIKPTLINSENFVIRSIDIVNELDGFTYEADNYAGNELLIKAIKDSHDITDGVIVASNGNVLLSAEL